MKKINLLFVIIAICFSSFAQTPTITSFSPASGPVGTLVTITGTNLSTPTAFTIGGVSAIVVSDNGTTLVGMVMPGATTGSVSVTTAGGSVSGSSNFSISPTPYPSVQQGNKLVGTGANNLYSGGQQGYSVAISGDGNTAIVGGWADDTLRGAVWIYTRAGTTWTQQGPKLVGTGAVNQSIAGANQGYAVALSADGNTALVGAPSDSIRRGAVWVWVRSNGIWTQQGPKLVSPSTSIYSNQGWSVALSADGNTAAVGAQVEDFIGATWIWTRTGGVWTQQGPKLVGTPNSSNEFQGSAVAISADGNTLIAGAYGDSSYYGGAYIFTRSGGTWSQQGPKLFGTGYINDAYQGWSVAISADGNTAIIGGRWDNVEEGAAWVFTRSGGVWTQQGAKLLATGNIGHAALGYSVALSADGNIAMIGGPGDDTSGAVWVFARTGNTWSQQAILIGTGAMGNASQGSALSISANGLTVIEGGYMDDTSRGAAWIFSTACTPNGSTATAWICNGDTFAFGSQHLTSSGTYIDTLTNINGCDSIITLTLTVHPLPVVTWMQTDTFDWFWCTPARTVVLDSVSPSGGHFYGPYVTDSTVYIPKVTFDSTFAITYTYTDSDGCANAVSKNFRFLIGCEGINSISNANSIHLYPNPNKGTFTLSTVNGQQSTNSFTISDMLGNVIAHDVINTNEQSIEVKDAAEGVYTLVVKGSQPVRFVVVR